MIKISRRLPPKSNTNPRPSKRRKITPTHPSHEPHHHLSTSPSLTPVVNDTPSSPPPSPSKPAKSPKPALQTFTEVDSLRKQAEPYRLAVAKLPIHLLYSSWSRGTEQHYIQVSCSAAAVQKMIINALSDTNQSHIQDRRQHRPELMAGQHRIEALKDYVKQTHSDSNDLWWICEFYNKDTLPVELDIKLRLVSAFDRDPTLFSIERNVNKKGIKKSMLDILCLTSEARFPISRLVTLWRSERWRPRVTCWCRTSLGRTIFNISKWYQIAGYRLDDMSDLPLYWFDTLKSNTYNTADSSLSATSTIKPVQKTARRSGFLSSLNKEAYDVRWDLIPAIEGLMVIIHGDDWWARRREDGDIDGADDMASWLDLRSRTLERQVLDYVCSHMTEFRDPSTKHYLDLMPEEHDEHYAERFSTGDLWTGLFHILGNIPEVKENPALRGVYASNELTVENNESDEGHPWSSEALCAIQVAYQGYEGILAGITSATAISEQDNQQQQQRQLPSLLPPEEHISHASNKVLCQQQGAVLSNYHIIKQPPLSQGFVPINTADRAQPEVGHLLQKLPKGDIRSGRRPSPGQS
ncbi:hypothetical protein DER46DRAFT_623670 [Fusarium sp. MPI-SDFR-AT-0072]|nr:hypothetical protein DER46DRAFT_623670 [Fusarium sp. MPI-SDFR-AT-0072]